MKRKILTMEDLINIWMKEFYNTTIKEEVNKNPELFKTSDWYKNYPVTQEQHNKWNTEAKEIYRKYFKYNKQLIDKVWGLTYLNTSPYINLTNDN